MSDLNAQIKVAAAKFGTPLYLYDFGKIDSAIGRVRSMLPQFELAYSIKANASLAVCSRIARCGLFAEIASSGELLLAQRAGFAASKIIFGGPAKQAFELERANRAGIFRINAESERELRFLETVESDLGVCLRINTASVSRERGEQMVGGASKFGFDEECLPKIVHKYRKTVNLRGIHVYAASQLLKAKHIIQNFRRTLLVFKRYQDLVAGSGDTLVFGGGFGVPYSANERPLDLRSVQRGIADALRDMKIGRPQRLLVELGRFLVAEAGFFVTRVVDIKTSHRKVILLTDGGINNFLRPAFMREQHPVYFIPRRQRNKCLPRKLGWIGGPLCTPIDLCRSDIDVSGINLGDLVIIKCAGAYGYSMSMHDFLGFGSAIEVALDEGKLRLIRRKRGMVEILRQQRS